MRTGLKGTRIAAASALLASAAAAAALAQDGPRPAALPPSINAVESNVARQGYFYVGGRYAGEPGREVMTGQMYVEVWVPREVRRSDLRKEQDPVPASAHGFCGIPQDSRCGRGL
jgi:hypothetical protein